MATTTEIRKGMVIMYNNEPTLILEREFYKPGKGGSFNRTKLKGLVSGKIITNTFRSGEAVEEVEVSTRNVQYSYADSEFAYFMDSETYEMVQIDLEAIEGKTDYLIADGKYQAMFFEDKPISLILPPKVVLTIAETADGGDRGNTTGNPMKEATMETGLVVRVPLFVNKGDRIVVSTETGEYVGKEK
ncbi:MAG: elongation factor P [Candidatus Dojkabacteria bacterium]